MSPRFAVHRRYLIIQHLLIDLTLRKWYILQVHSSPFTATFTLMNTLRANSTSQLIIRTRVVPEGAFLVESFIRISHTLTFPPRIAWNYRKRSNWIGSRMRFNTLKVIAPGVGPPSIKINPFSAIFTPKYFVKSMADLRRSDTGSIQFLNTRTTTRKWWKWWKINHFFRI